MSEPRLSLSEWARVRSAVANAIGAQTSSKRVDLIADSLLEQGFIDVEAVLQKTAPMIPETITIPRAYEPDLEEELFDE